MEIINAIICEDEIEKGRIFEGRIGGIEKVLGMNIMRVDNVGWWFSDIVHCVLYVWLMMALRGETCGEFIKKKKQMEEARQKVKSYRYGMRGEFAPDNHPKEGLFACLEGEVLEEHDEIFAGYNSVLFYSRRLSEEEKAKYKLEEIE